jgi:type II secretory pathway component PulL
MPVLLDGVAGSVVSTVQPALSLLEKSVIGAVLVVCIGLMIAAIASLIRVQDARVADQKEAGRTLTMTHDKMVDAFGKFKGTLETLSKSEDTTQQGLLQLSKDVTALTGKVDLMIIMGKGDRQ